MEHHYFGSTVYGWRVGESVDEVIKGLVKDAGKSSLALNIKNRGGLEVSVCRVHAPIKAQYEIRSFMPVGFHCDLLKDYKVVDLKGKYVEVENE